jgi:predicted secreted protein
MGWISGIAVYAIIWWLVIFMVLPWGVQTIGADDVAKGHASSAPRRPRMLLKTAVTTVVAAVLWVIVFAIIESGAITFSQQ